MKSIREIKHAFDGKLVGRDEMKQYVCEVLLKMPEEIQEFVTHNIWFFASMKDAWAFTFTGNDLRDQHLIFLSDELLEQDREQIYYTIAHEIGHVVLGHKNSVTVKQTQKEINQQEREADQFARKYL